MLGLREEITTHPLYVYNNREKTDERFRNQYWPHLPKLPSQQICCNFFSSLLHIFFSSSVRAVTNSPSLSSFLCAGGEAGRLPRAWKPCTRPTHKDTDTVRELLKHYWFLMHREKERWAEQMFTSDPNLPLQHLHWSIQWIHRWTIQIKMNQTELNVTKTEGIPPGECYTYTILPISCVLCFVRKPNPKNSQTLTCWVSWLWPVQIEENFPHVNIRALQSWSSSPSGTEWDPPSARVGRVHPLSSWAQTPPAVVHWGSWGSSPPRLSLSLQLSPWTHCASSPWRGRRDGCVLHECAHTHHMPPMQRPCGETQLSLYHSHA